MKKKIAGLILIIIILGGILTLTGCGKKKEENKTEQNYVSESTELEQLSFAELIERYTKNEKNLNGAVIENYCSPSEYKCLDSECSGVISKIIRV